MWVTSKTLGLRGRRAHASPARPIALASGDSSEDAWQHGPLRSGLAELGEQDSDTDDSILTFLPKSGKGEDKCDKGVVYSSEGDIGDSTTGKV